MSMSMSLISSAPASHTTTDEGTIALHAPSQSPSMSSPSSPSVSQAPIVVQEGSQGSDGSTEPPSLIPTNVTSPSISPTARSSDEIKEGEIQTGVVAAESISAGLSTLTSTLVGVSVVALVAVLVAFVVRKKAKSNAALKDAVVGSASTSGSGSVSDISTVAIPSAAAPAET